MLHLTQLYSSRRPGAVAVRLVELLLYRYYTKIKNYTIVNYTIILRYIIDLTNTRIDLLLPHTDAKMRCDNVHSYFSYNLFFQHRIHQPNLTSLEPRVRLTPTVAATFSTYWLDKNKALRANRSSV